MNKTLILHDLDTNEAKAVFGYISDRTLFPASEEYKHCMGCFGCWLKTPGRCVIADRASDFAPLMASHDRLVIISRMVFGGLSPGVKTVLDRSIGFILPFFKIVNGEMHHTKRYEKSPDLTYILYGSDIKDREKETAKKLIAANALNFSCENYSVHFCPSVDKVGEVLA